VVCRHITVAKLQQLASRWIYLYILKCDTQNREPKTYDNIAQKDFSAGNMNGTFLYILKRG
jgi:hypothetical protein